MANTKPARSRRGPAPAPEAPKVNNARKLDVVLRAGATEERIVAEMALGPLVGSISTALDYSKALMGDLVLQDCVDVAEGAIKAVNDGDMSKLEGMLTAQAIALDAMFNNFAKRAVHAQYLPQMDTYTRLAMKAQSQCRTTVEAIAEIKFPKSATFIKQANIAQQQQVNNGKVPVRAREKDITPTNEVLTESAHAALDTGRTGAAIGIDTQLEAVGASNGATH